MKKLLAIIVLCMFVFGCTDQPTDPTSKELKSILPNNDDTENLYNRADPAHIQSDQYASAIDRSFLAAHTQFALKCFKEIEDAEPGDQNIFFSPLSLYIALAMMFNGAEGSTYNAMAQTLELGDFSLEEINEQFLNLVMSLENADHSVTFDNANSAWIDDGFPVSGDYRQRIIDFFQSEIQNLDLHAPETISIINNWASEHTGGRITEIVNQIPADEVLILINALNFIGNWIFEFDPRLTHSEWFFLADGSHKSVQMMDNTGKDYYYLFADNFNAARMPYGRDIFAMYVFLPDEGYSVDAFINELNPGDWEDWMNSFQYLENLVDRETYLRFFFQYPKFRFHYDISLNDILTSLGMGIAFSGAANFQGITPLPLWISSAKQKTFVEVDEYGTVASGITIVEGQTGLPPMSQFEVNRPFFFVIQDDRSGAILFMGKIVDPVIE